MKFYGAVANSVKIDAIKTILYVRTLMKFCHIFYIFIPVLINRVNRVHNLSSDYYFLENYYTESHALLKAVNEMLTCVPYG
jgi:hypothetical protein